MPGTIRKIIDRIKDVRSGGDSLVALTIETRLVLQGFDPQRFDYEDPDDPARLARINDIARELRVDVSDLLHSADVDPDPSAEPGPMPRPPVRSADAGSAMAMPRSVAGRGDELGDLERQAEPAAAVAEPSPAGGVPEPEIEDDHPLHQFADLIEEALDQLATVPPAGERTGASFAVLIKASLLMALYSVRNDRNLCDQIRQNNMYRWFLGLRPGEGRFDPDDFGVDREDTVESDAGRQVLKGVVPQAARMKLFRSDRLEVNGPLLKSWGT